MSSIHRCQVQWGRMDHASCCGSASEIETPTSIKNPTSRNSSSTSQPRRAYEESNGENQPASGRLRPGHVFECKAHRRCDATDEARTPPVAAEIAGEFQKENQTTVALFGANRKRSSDRLGRLALVTHLSVRLCIGPANPSTCLGLDSIREIPTRGNTKS